MFPCLVHRIHLVHASSVIAPRVIVITLSVPRVPVLYTSDAMEFTLVKTLFRFAPLCVASEPQSITRVPCVPRVEAACTARGCFTRALGCGNLSREIGLLTFLPAKRSTLDSEDCCARLDLSIARLGSCGANVAKECYLVDPASSHMLVSKIKPCMCKYELIQTVKLRMAH